ncbi:MAG: hypothetical protein J6R22_02070 [Alphaproteobacteria bacterium]|nr:hypothetical protein [Alphaproteobacteria bacterium]
MSNEKIMHICKKKYMPEQCKNNLCKDWLPDGRCPKCNWAHCSDMLEVSKTEYTIMEYLLSIQQKQKQIMQEINNLKQNQK